MNKKQRVISYSISMVLFSIGVSCFIVAAVVQDKLGNTFANIMVLLGLVFLILSLVYLVLKAPKMISSEMEERAERLGLENKFFSTIKIEESMYSLREKFIRKGYKQGDNYLHKKKFSFSKDYINYYLFTVDNVNLMQYIEDFLKNINLIIESQKRLNKNNLIYLVFFKYNISDDEMMTIKNMIINQDVFQELPHYMSDAVVPIVYDIEKHEYLLRTTNMKLSLKPIDIAIRKFCEIVIY